MPSPGCRQLRATVLRVVAQRSTGRASLHHELVSPRRFPEPFGELRRLGQRRALERHRRSSRTEPSCRSPSLLTRTVSQSPTCRSGSTSRRSWRTASMTWLTPDTCASESRPPCVFTGERATELDPSVLDERSALAAFAEAQRLEPREHEPAERIVQLRAVDVVGTESGHREGRRCRGVQALDERHVVLLRDRRRWVSVPFTQPFDDHRLLREIARTIDRRDHDRAGTVGLQGAVEEPEWARRSSSLPGALPG